ncbi:MAG: methyltransferase domain-containing protein [Azospirillaceae bacterium]|nr:methyltransferase domain-containing protein [Azospirillaceae bacterium]
MGTRSIHRTRNTGMLDALSFLRVWATAPLRVGAIAPSGEALADLITRDITPAMAPVLELGPGTGVFTRALLKRGIPESELTLIEYDEDFARMLRLRFPAVEVLRMDAARLPRSRIADGRALGAVVSGLPILSFPLRKVMAILIGAFNLLRHGGAFYQFTYGPVCPIRKRVLDRLGLKATRVGRAFLNLPPAAVYRITRAAPAALAFDNNAAG